MRVIGSISREGAGAGAPKRGGALFGLDARRRLYTEPGKAGPTCHHRRDRPHKTVRRTPSPVHTVRVTP